MTKLSSEEHSALKRALLSSVKKRPMTRTVSPSPEQSRKLAERLRQKEPSGSRSIDGKQLINRRNFDGDEAADALESAQAEIARLTAALEQIRDLNSDNYDSDRAWALAMQLRAGTALHGWLGHKAALKGNQP